MAMKTRESLSRTPRIAPALSWIPEMASNQKVTLVYHDLSDVQWARDALEKTPKVPLLVILITQPLLLPRRPRILYLMPSV